MRLVRIAAVMSALVVLSAGAGVAKHEPYEPAIDPADFVGVVDHPYFPLTPGVTMIYAGEVDGEEVYIEEFVTHDTVTILGVTCIEVRVREWVDGEFAEETFDWYAQHLDGTVWYFGEFATEFEDGLPVSNEGSWEAGVDGAQPGIIMLAAPRTGIQYRQEFYEGVAEDMGQVISLRRSGCVEFDCYEGVLQTLEWSPLEPGHREFKYYAWGVGRILEVALHGHAGSVELVDIVGE